MPATDAALCAALLALAEHELACVEAAAYDELEAVDARRRELLDALGPPRAGRLADADRGRLQAAARVQQLAGEAMRQRRDALAGELGRNGHARRAAAGYRAAASL